ncbi:WD40 repeat-like protein [Coprinopsis marcescibilis]|uniref:WD40 repeat-like protein n=1 Tax=Coprinopsis marcescibilis TaxID=230819 RepID=A0A5C3L2V1_COPMA|nr:WD40 repeat-like protein [Coprinopsis marcescibilis]
MLPSPSSSPQHGPLHTRTNLPPKQPTRQTSLKALLLTPPDERKPKRQSLLTAFGPQKRIKLELTSQDLDSAESETDSSEYEDSDDECEMRVDPPAPAHPMRNLSKLLNKPGGPLNPRQYRPSSEQLLRSFVSSHKSDVYKCPSTREDRYLAPPYACAYSNGSKYGDQSLLAVADEEGTVNIFNTTKRQDWEQAPQHQSLQIHNNGVFQVKWNHDDTSLATCSGDQSVRITDISTSKITHVLRGQSSTAKCISWDPSHTQLLTSGNRDGSICLWDLRAGTPHGDEGLDVLKPSQVILDAHLPPQCKPKRGRKAKHASAAPGVTSLLYPEGHPYTLISAGTADGILKSWDLRFLHPSPDDRSPTKAKSKSKSKPKNVAMPLLSSPIDPTGLVSRRPRGILSLAAGHGPTAGLIFALGADSHVHTYSLPTLQPYINSSITHDSLRGDSFYLSLSMSSCGRWLATGSTSQNGTALLFDVEKAPFGNLTSPVVLSAQVGEVGAVDWSRDSLATCADDGTVRVWRPDIDARRQCVDDPEESKWNWACAS